MLLQEMREEAHLPRFRGGEREMGGHDDCRQVYTVSKSYDNLQTRSYEAIICLIYCATCTRSTDLVVLFGCRVVLRDMCGHCRETSSKYDEGEPREQDVQRRCSNYPHQVSSYSGEP
jgi:hypothetical protein